MRPLSTAKRLRTQALHGIIECVGRAPWALRLYIVERIERVPARALYHSRVDLHQRRRRNY